MSDLSVPASRKLSFVELLIATSIGGLLLAVVAPAYRSATFEADLAKCRSNLHQVGAALRYYAADHEGQFPPVVLGQTPGNPIPLFYTNVGSGDPNSDARGVGYLVGRPLGYGEVGYLQSWSPLLCPSQKSYSHPVLGRALTNIGYLAAWIPERYQTDAYTRSNWTNGSVNSNPLMPILMDFGWDVGLFPDGSAVTIPSHYREIPGTATGEPVGYINSLHVGGHVTTRSIDDANRQKTLGTLVRFLGTGVVDPRPL